MWGFRLTADGTPHPVHKHPDREKEKPMNRTRLRLGLVITAALAASAFADMSSLDPAKPNDQGFEGDGVVCATVAISNLLSYIDQNQPGAGNLIKDTETPKSVQESIQKRFGSGTWPSGTAAKKATEQELAARGFTGHVKLFGRKDLTYENLLYEWNHQERIILFMVDKKDPKIGHAVLLWGLEGNKDAAEKKLMVTDPNGHPNQNPTIGGKTVTHDGESHLTNALTFESQNGLPLWGITYTTPKHTYDLGGGNTIEYDPYTWDGYVIGFMSVSDVVPVPAPGAVVLACCGLVLLGHHRRRLT